MQQPQEAAEERKLAKQQAAQKAVEKARAVCVSTSTPVTVDTTGCEAKSCSNFASLLFTSAIVMCLSNRSSIMRRFRFECVTCRITI